MSFKDQDEQEAAAFNEKLNAQARQLSRPLMTDTPTPTAPETDELEKLLAEAAEIASERREKSAESHMFAMAARNAIPPGNADGWQMAADYALRTARVLEQTAGIAEDLIRLRSEVATLQEAVAKWSGRAIAAQASLATLRASEARMREALVRLKAYNENIDAGRMNYRPKDHVAVADAALQGETK